LGEYAQASAEWERLRRPVPAWFPDAKFGIFVHWGAYSVPAWAEPVGELGAVDEQTWFAHNPYAEWYWNTVRVDGSPARAHHREVYGDAPYDDFLDAWDACDFDPAEWAELFARAGARYVIPTTKHHDGIALWDAPGTGDRNTVHRGPKRDLVREIATAARNCGLRFGVYYSGGLDWSVSNLPAITTSKGVRTVRPTDAAYNAYAYLHVRDLVDRFEPDVLWNDIEWPDAGKHALPFGLFQLLQHYYRTVPEGVVNDRWGTGYYDFATSEYQAHLEAEKAPVWQNCRGIGLSFGYNQVEDASHTLSGPDLVRHFVDVVSRGGSLLLNVGPTARGTIPELQRDRLEHLGAWMRRAGEAIYGTRPVEHGTAQASATPWARWTQKGRRVWAIVEPGGKGPHSLALRARPEALELASASLIGGPRVQAHPRGDEVVVELPHIDGDVPAVISFELRT